MFRKLSTAALLAALVSLPALAQQGSGKGGPGGGNPGGTPSVDPSQKTVVTGDVVSLAAAPGAGMPTLTVRKSDGAEGAYVLGPYRYIVEKGFSAVAGDRVELTLFACTACDQGVAVAEVKNLTRGLTLPLRAEDGTPLFAGGRGRGGWGHGQGQGRGRGPEAGQCDGTGPDLSRKATLDGTVKSFTGGFRQGRPTLVLLTSGGEKSVLVSPFRALRASGLVIAEGMRLEVVVAPVTVDQQEAWVALSVKDLATGATVELREASTGRPAGCTRS